MTRLSLRAWGIALSTIAALASPPPDARADVLTQHYDTSRTGATLDETALTTSSVNANKFGKVFTRAVAGSVYAQPLYVSQLDMPAVGTRNVLFVATMHNYVYAFDADDPQASTPLWERHLEPSSTLTDSNVGNACGTYKDISTEIGIVGTPVIDRTASIMYLVTFTRTGAANSAQATYAHWLHALDLGSGGERLSGPFKIAASVPGTGQGSAGGNIAFQSQYQNQRSSLLLANGNVYIAFSAYCDSGPYHGWILAYDAATLAQKYKFNTTPDGNAGGLWQAGQGPALDASGNLYMMSGNGTTNIQNATPGSSLSTAFIKLSPSLAVVDWFVPFNYGNLNGKDQDLGSAGIMLMPSTNLVVGGGKEGKIYVLNPNALGGYHAGADSQITQSWQATFPSPSNVEGHIHGSIVHWESPAGPAIYVWGENDFLRSYSFANGAFNTTPVTSTMRAGSGMPGGILSISANGNTAGSGIVWSSMPISANANQAVVPGMLRAFDASNVATELWNSEITAARDASALFGKFAPPTIANGHVYLATFSGQVVAYGLLASTTALATSGTPSTFGQPVTFTAGVSGPAAGAPSGTMAFKDGGALLANVPLDATGTAQWTAATLAVGAHAITAEYGGDANFNPSTSSTVTQTVTKAASVTSLDAAPPGASFGQTVTLTATVGSTVTTIPGGMVTFYDGAASIGTATLAGGSATFASSALAAGAHSFSAAYAGDASFDGSTSVAVPFAIAQAGTTSTLASDGTPSLVGAPVVLTANVATGASVASGAAVPTGTFTFAEGATALGTSPVDATGRATWTVATLAAGAHTVGASYSGDGNYAASDAPPITQVVTDPPDAGSPDAGANDGGPLDAGADDASDSGAIADAGSGDSGSSDSGSQADGGAQVDSGAPHDSGAPVDAAAPPDSGEEVDGSADGGGGSGDSGGCSCRSARSTNGGGDGSAAALLVLAAAASVKRRKRST